MTELGQAPAGLELINLAEFQRKVALIKNSGLDKLQIVLDFDRTLTVTTSESIADVTSWSIMGHHLPDEGKRAQHELYKIYRTKELEGSMTIKDAEDWWRSVLGIFVEHRLDMHVVESDFINRVAPRPGTHELFDWSREHDVPVIILSAGITDVIDMWCRYHGLAPSLIISTPLVLDDHGCVVGWDDAKLVHTLNKRETGDAHGQGLLHSRPNTILAGDSVNDYDMAPGVESTIRYLIEDKRVDEGGSLSSGAARFDAIIRHGGLGSIRQLLDELS